MYSGRLVFSQIMDYLPSKQFRRIVKKYSGNHKVKHFKCSSQFRCMAFGQMAYRTSMRDIVRCLRAHQSKLYHMGIRGGISLNNLSNSNMQRDWRIYAEYGQVLIDIARRLYADESFCEEVSEPVYALDSTTISLSLSLFPWADFRDDVGGVKLHTLMELPSSIPTFLQITEARPHDVNVLDSLILEPGAYYVMDRGYMDFARLYRIARSGAFFVTRLKRNVKLRRRYSHDKDTALGILSDQTVVAVEEKSYNHYPAPLRRVRFRDEEQGRSFAFLTNNFDLAARTVADLFKSRWQIELFFKWIKQHLQIKSFFGHTMNAVKTQIWIAVSTYVLVAIIRKKLGLEHLSLYNILQVLSVSLFCYVDLPQLLRETDFEPGDYNNPNQLQLFNL
ncbi:IS4 family transposase [Candidatus Fermentibacteria bacterium]|nr:IS4 family transposase [Candidatus Fermentibacteria bacterium]